MNKCKECQGDVAPERKDQEFCNSYCRQKSSSRAYHHSHKEDKIYLVKRKANFNQWYILNKDKQKVNCLRNYKKDKRLWDIRGFNNRNKERLLAFLEHKCINCGKKTSKILFIKDKTNIKVPRLFRYKKEQSNKDLKEYAEKYLGMLCSQDCLGLMRRKDNFDYAQDEESIRRGA